MFFFLIICHLVTALSFYVVEFFWFLFFFFIYFSYHLLK